MIAVSAALYMPTTHVPRPEFRVAFPTAGYPWEIPAGYSDQTVNALVNVTFSRNASVHPQRVTIPFEVSVNAQAQEAIVGRIQAIRALNDGWLGGHSAAPDTHLLDWLDQNSALLAATSNTISIIPLGDGAVCLEWRADDVEYTVELQPDNRMIFVADNTRTDELNEEETNLEASAFADFISRGSFA